MESVPLKRSKHQGNLWNQKCLRGHVTLIVGTHWFVSSSLSRECSSLPLSFILEFLTPGIPWLGECHRIWSKRSLYLTSMAGTFLEGLVVKNYFHCKRCRFPPWQGNPRSHMLHGNAKNFVKLNGFHLQAVEYGQINSLLYALYLSFQSK